jgi:hypothetical protein
MEEREGIPFRSDSDLLPSNNLYSTLIELREAVSALGPWTRVCHDKSAFVFYFFKMEFLSCLQYHTYFTYKRVSNVKEGEDLLTAMGRERKRAKVRAVLLIYLQMSKCQE